MDWKCMAPGIILLLVKLTGTSLFVVFMPKIFPGGILTFVPENYTAPIPWNESFPRWERYRGSDYWFTEDMHFWIDCQALCMKWTSNLLIINDEKELEFIRNKTTAGDYFIGLTYSESKNEWLWINDAGLQRNLFAMNPNVDGKECATITADKVSPVLCYQESHCICEKNDASLV
ncbi:C-type lectin domain family 5 member A-like isoform X2 [Rhineura floridana]|uniref:C-type lectin domain family 5 member A-like isoform X2 n=1 Tax=Rhineura floridana TaxID=261503 RepID=UPI002AC87324|nr:C-type lectin domain family 5 member A-like isoform X2 [Rhineura floridana]